MKAGSGGQRPQGAKMFHAAAVLPNALTRITNTR
jgi:hypothetical protein